MGLGDFISGIFGSKNEEKAQGYNVDPNAYQYGGHAGGAQQASDAATYQQTLANAKGQEYGAQQQNLYNRGNSGLDQSNAALGMATDARGAQQDALGMARNRAAGNDLISQRIAGQQSTQLAQQQASAAAGARGPAALALAQQNAAANTAQGQSAIGANAMTAGAQERLGYEQNYANQAQGIRGMDLGQVGAANQTAGTAFGAGAQSGALGNAAGQLGLGYGQLGNQIQTTQLAAGMNQQAQQSSNALGAQGINAGVGGQNAAMNQSNAFGALGLVSSGLGAAAGGMGGGGGGKAVGGSTSGGHPYLVGEQGPELIVPKKDGFVFTKPQTDFIMATATPEQRRAMGGGVQGYARADGGPVQGAPGSPGWLDAYMASQGAVAPATTGSVDLPAQQQAAAAFGPEGDAARQQRIATYEQDLASRPTDTGAAQVLGIGLSGAYGAPGGLGGKSENAEVLKGMRSAGVETQGAKADAKKDAGDKPKAERPTLGSMLGSAGNQLAAQGQKIDTAYHGPGGYVAPQFVQLPGRAFGGPIQAGGDPYGSMALSPGGGSMDVAGSLAKTNALDTQYLRSPGGLVSYAREEGGDVKGVEAEHASRQAQREAASGQLVRGNIDLTNRPEVRNADGSVSTVRSMSFQDDNGREVLIPTVVGGRVVSNSDAVAHYRRTGQHLGMFDSPAAATAYAQRLHDDYANGVYKREEGGPVKGGEPRGQFLTDARDRGIAMGDRVADGLSEAIPYAGGVQGALWNRSAFGQALHAVVPAIVEAVSRPAPKKDEPRPAEPQGAPLVALAGGALGALRPAPAVVAAQSPAQRTPLPSDEDKAAGVVPVMRASGGLVRGRKRADDDEERGAMAALRGAK